MEISYLKEWLSYGLSLAALVAGFVAYFIGKIIKKKKKTKDIISPELDFPEHFWDVHVNLQETLTELRIKLDCARANLIQFHNSGYFFNGISMKKMSLTHESLERSISSEISNHQDLLMSMFLPILEIVRKDSSALYHVSDMEDSYAKQHLESSNIIAFSILPVQQNNNIIGYIMAQWCSWNKVENIDVSLVEDWINRSQTLVEVELINQKRKMKHK